ncbi:SigE family RNA polymerase sigma factor [Oryzihumus leptocrescens]
MAERGERTGMGSQRWAAGTALTDLYAAHWASLVRLAWLLVRDQQVAEEAVQDAFVSMHARWQQLRDPEAALAYLRRSVVNTSRSVVRHRVVEDRHLAREASSPTSPWRTTEASAEERAVAHEQGEELLSALRGLPRRQREVLVLRYYLDLTEAQIADALGISPGSVKSHAHRGLSSLRTQMEPQS